MSEKKTHEQDPEIVLTDADIDQASDQQEPTETLSAEELEHIQQKARLADELQDKNIRLVADMENLRKRLTQEKTDAIKYANESLLETILPVLDNFELALQSMEQTDNLQAIKDGVKMVQSQFKQVLKQEGLDEIQALGTPFDPNLHDALSQIDDPSQPADTVVKETRKGYLLKGRLLRPAAVIVSK